MDRLKKNLLYRFSSYSSDQKRLHLSKLKNFQLLQNPYHRIESESRGTEAHRLAGFQNFVTFLLDSFLATLKPRFRATQKNSSIHSICIIIKMHVLNMYRRNISHPLRMYQSGMFCPFCWLQLQKKTINAIQGMSQTSTQYCCADGVRS